MKNIRLLGILIITVVLLGGTGSSIAANTFEDPKGRFSIDLPDGWKLDPQTDESVYVFKGGDSSIILEYSSTTSERGALFLSGMNTLKASGLANASSVDDAKDMKVNNNKARLGLYSDEIAYGSIKVKLYGLLGSIELKEGGLYFLSVLNDTTLKTMRGALDKSFYSIRNVGDAVTGASGITTASKDILEVKKPTGASSTFEHEHLSLTVPPGWVSSEIPKGVEKEVIGWLTSDYIPGATIMVVCYRGITRNFTNIRIGGLRTIAASYPKGQKSLKDKTKIRTEQGKRALYELWQGVSDAGLMQSPMGIVKTKHCWALMIGYAPDSFGSQLEEDFMKVLNSAR